jgi:hypothetical protein
MADDQINLLAAQNAFEQHSAAAWVERFLRIPEPFGRGYYTPWVSLSLNRLLASPAS